MSYEKLLDDLETLQKSYAAADEDAEKIKAAAADGAADKGDDELDADGKPTAKKADDGEGQGEGEGKAAAEVGPLTKSFSGTTDKGEPFEAVDATDLIKSLTGRIDDLAKGVEDDKAEKSDLTKSLEILVGVVTRQSTMIKSLQENYAVLANSGSGRKSVVSPSLDMVKSLQDNAPLNATSFMQKANAAYDSGRISGKDLTICDVALRHGAEIDQAIVSKIMAG